MEIIKPTEISLFEDSIKSTVLPTTANTLTTERSLTETAVKQTLLPSNNLNTEVDMIFSTHSVIMTTDASASTTAILIGVIGVMFVALTLGGIICLCIIFIQRRSKSLTKNNKVTTEKESSNSLPREFEIQETDVNGEYEMIEDYMNMCKPTGCHEIDINVIKNQAYASVPQSS